MGTDLFMSFVAADRGLAQTLAWDLEVAGHHVTTDRVELADGDDLASALGLREPQETTVAVLTPSYLRTLAEQPAATAIVREQATSEPRSLVAVRIRPCVTNNVLPGVPIIDLVGLDDASMRGLLRELPSPDIATALRLEDVFKRSGMPTVTFVEPEGFDRLTLSLRQHGRTTVIEGPSGIGKTSALRRALEHLEGDAALRGATVLNALRDDDLRRLHEIQTWHSGTVAVDEFHRLDAALRGQVADYVKYLSDAERRDRRLILIGVPGTGDRLVQQSPGLAGRVDIFGIAAARDEAVLAMIAHGEQALNISIQDKEGIVSAARGSLQVAQILCWETCIAAEIHERQPRRKEIRENVDAVLAKALEELEPKFRDLVGAFESADRSDAAIGRELLFELARSADNSVALAPLRATRPDLEVDVERFVRGDLIEHVRAACPDHERQILFEEHRLAVRDPQLAFCLRTRFGITRSHVFVSYSHEDEEWLDLMLRHLRPHQNQGDIKVWDDTMLRGGEEWLTEITSAIASASVAILLVSVDFLGSQFVTQNELPQLLEGAERGGLTILPVIVRPCAFEETYSLSRFQAMNNPRRPLAQMQPWEREKVCQRVARRVRDAVRRSALG